jgi:hypothetical protein
MIDLKVTTIGGPEIGRKLAQADSGIRDVIRNELEVVGEEIVQNAQRAAPRKSGIMASKIIWFFGKRGKRTVRTPTGKQRITKVTERKYKDGRIFFSVMPTGRVAHLMERGVNATFDQRPGRRQKEANKVRGNSTAKVTHLAEGPVYRYQRTLRIAPRPFFGPAVDAAGGAAGVNARLQTALDNFARVMGESA